jgi:hypothetical protein
MKRWFLATLMGLTLLFTTPVFARDFSASTIRTRMEDLNVELAELETHEFADDAAGEFATCRLEVGEIQGLLARDEIGDAGAVLLRLEARKFLIESLLERATFENLAQQRETELFEMQSEADQLQVDLAATEQRRNTLQEQVSDIVESTQQDEK